MAPRKAKSESVTETVANHEGQVDFSLFGETNETTIVVAETKPEVAKPTLGITRKYIEGTLKKYLTLKINGIDDAAGAIAVSEARKSCVKARNLVENSRKEAKAFYLEEGRKIDSQAKELQIEIEPIEKHCIAEEQRIENELAKEREKLLDAREIVRNQQIAAIGGIPKSMCIMLGDNYVRVCESEQFEEFLGKVIAENKRIADEEKERAEAAERNRIEQQRLADLKAEQDRIAAELEASQKAEQNRLDAIKAENDRVAAENAKRAKELEEREAAINAAQDKIEAEKAEAEKAEAARVESAKLTPIQNEIVDSVLVNSEQVKETLFGDSTLGKLCNTSRPIAFRPFPPVPATVRRYSFVGVVKVDVRAEGDIVSCFFDAGVDSVIGEMSRETAVSLLEQLEESLSVKLPEVRTEIDIVNGLI